MTCDDWLVVLEPRLAGPLFDPQTVGRLRRLARNLPGELQGTLELRLSHDAAPVDLSLRLRTAAQARDMASRLPPSPVLDFLSRWSEPESSLSPVRSVWLELDLDREPAVDTVPVPVVCAKLPRGVDSGWVLDALLPALQGHLVSAGQRDLIRFCLDALPASACLLYVFNLQARGSDAVRLEIFGMETSQILGYLRKVAPEREPETIEAAPLLEGAERLHLSFDVAEEILPRVGIEGSFPRQPPRELRWERLFARLVEKGLCTPEKRDAALAWPGYDSFWTAPERWPVAKIGPQGFCVRALSHLKVVCRPARPPEAKGYLVFGPLERSAAGAASSPASASVFST